MPWPLLEQKLNISRTPALWIAQPSSISGRTLPKGVFTRSYRKASSGSVMASKMRVKVSRPPTTRVAMP